MKLTLAFDEEDMLDGPELADVLERFVEHEAPELFERLDEHEMPEKWNRNENSIHEIDEQELNDLSMNAF